MDDVIRNMLPAVESFVIQISIVSIKLSIVPVKCHTLSFTFQVKSDGTKIQLFSQMNIKINQH